MSLAPVLDGLRRDAIQLAATRRALARLNHIIEHPDETAADMIEQWAIKTPEAFAILYARWAESQGGGRGEPVARRTRMPRLYAYSAAAGAPISAGFSRSRRR